VAATFASLLRPEHVFIGLPAGPRDDVLRAFLDRVVAAGTLTEDESTTVLRAVLKRERTGTTGIGRGVAVPHCKTTAVKAPFVAFARTVEPIDYGAADGDPVDSLFLVVSPPESADLHVEVLRSVAKIARDDYTTRVLRNTPSAESIHDLLRELDQQ
jgi:mannitol/fructose-specific phosphotransferase system IIA component (Ntr-type)